MVKETRSQSVHAKTASKETLTAILNVRNTRIMQRNPMKSDEQYILYVNGFPEGIGTRAELIRKLNINGNHFSTLLFNRKRKPNATRVIYPLSELDYEEGEENELD